MMRRSFGEEVRSKRARQPLNDATTVDGTQEAPSAIERINKLEKVLALVNSPNQGEALNAARMAMKLSRAWEIDLAHLRGPAGDLVENLLEIVAQSGHGRFYSPHAVPVDRVSECSDSETERRSLPTFVKAHFRRRRGGPPFPVRPHRRRRRGRKSSSTRGGCVRGERRPEVFR